jgi:uncharacterized membrane protein
MILRNPEALWLLLCLPIFIGGWFWRGKRLPVSALALRLLIVICIVTALADPVIARIANTSGTTVLLVDQSDSLGETAKAELRGQAERIARDSEQTSVDTHVLFFGANVAVPFGAPVAPESQGPLRTDDTDLAGALRTARGLIGAGGGRVILVSDGAQTRGDALAEAQALADIGVPVDTLAQVIPEQPEMWVAGVEAPQTLREGEEYSVRIIVGSRAQGMAQLSLLDGATQLATQQVNLSPGENLFTLQSRAGQPGIARLSATITGQPDTSDRNNSASATALIAPPPNVLLVEGQGGGAAPLQVALRAESVEADVIRAQDIPARLSDLDMYDGIVLIDVPAGDLSLDQMTTMREFVRSEGRGLVATGGRASFTLGAYKGTPLEEVLPVEMTPPPRPERSDVTMLLIIDQSASMGSSGGISKFDMAKEAAILATNSLRDEDRIGVLAFDTLQQWAVEFQQLGTGLGLAQIQERISALGLGGGTDIYGALFVGLDALEQQPGQVRHAVLLTDGRSFTTDRGPYRALLDQARAQDITLSAIALGDDADTVLLQELADWGAGRYHFASTPEDIPRLTLLESEIARTEPQVEGDFRAELSEPHPVVRDFAPNQIPNLGGYVATTLKPEAEMVLKSPEEDPVLSAWQYGLGRAVAWTPSVEAPWAPNWQNWHQYGQFWAQIIRYTLPEPDSGPLQVRVTPRGDEVILNADSLAPGGATVDLADTEATITLPDGTTRAVPLRQTGPGHYAQSIRLPTDGPYAIEVIQRKDTLERRAIAGYVEPYSAEYLPGQDGAALLTRISEVTGGQALTDLRDLGASPTEQPRETTGLWTWLLLAAALLWPVEIAVRRGWLRFG